MVQLVLVYCLSANAQACVERRPVLDVPPSPMACLMVAQPVAARYLEDHPAYRLASFRCEMSNKPERAA